MANSGTKNQFLSQIRHVAIICYSACLLVKIMILAEIPQDLVDGANASVGHASKNFMRMNSENGAGVKK